MQSISAMNKVRVIALMTGVLLLIASTANARVLSMTGQWFQNRGPLIDIPQAGGAQFCGGPIQDGCLAGFAPKFGGIPGDGTVNATGSSPANFQIETHAFSVYPGIHWVGAVNIAPTVQQLASTFTFMGPARMEENGQLAGKAHMMENAWNLDPGQAPRLAADFTWCPGGGAGGLGDGPGVGPNCSAPNNATPNTGNWNGIVRYTAGPNRFGGTMAMMMGGEGWVSVNINFGAGPMIAHLTINAGGNRNPQVPGQGYGVRNFNNFPPAPIFASFMTNFPCTVPYVNLPSGCGRITAQGPAVGPGVSVPPDSQVNFGMPWTTGMITVNNTGTNNGKAATSTLVATGSDNRTALGAGRITLVAGGTTHRYSQAQAPANPQNYAALDIVTMEIGESPVPAMSPMGLATAAVLMMLAGGYAFRNRFGSKE